MCLAPWTQTEAFLAQEIISPVETTWNCFKVRKKILFATLLSCQENCYGIEDGSHERWATAHKKCMDFQDSTITHWSLPSGGGNMPAKIVLPLKKRPITLTLFQANSFWFPPSSDSRLGRVTASYTFPHSLLIQISGQKSIMAGNSRSDPEWVLACNPSINQSISVMLSAWWANPLMR